MRKRLRKKLKIKRFKVLYNSILDGLEEKTFSVFENLKVESDGDTVHFSVVYDPIFLFRQEVILKKLSNKEEII